MNPETPEESFSALNLKPSDFSQMAAIESACHILAKNLEPNELLSSEKIIYWWLKNTCRKHFIQYINNPNFLEELIESIIRKNELSKEYAIATTIKLSLMTIKMREQIHDITNTLAGAYSTGELISVTVGNIRDTGELTDLPSLYTDTTRLTDSLDGAFGLLKMMKMDPENKKESCDFNFIFEALLHNFKNQHKGKIKTKIHLNQTVKVKIKLGELTSVIQNLITNAAEAMPNGGLLKIESKILELGSKKYLQLSVTDNGCGIDAELGNSIYNYLATTKTKKTKGDPDRGTGLHHTKTILEKAGGSIAHQSKTGKDSGTTFIITIPILDSESKQNKSGLISQP